jgi:hypothetical protein
MFALRVPSGYSAEFHGAVISLMGLKFSQPLTFMLAPIGTDNLNSPGIPAHGVTISDSLRAISASRPRLAC